MSIKVKKVSIIVPVYNVEKYLQKCIDSILAQTYTNYEVILVDDGSTDSSGKICDTYFGGHIRCFHKANGGLSDARNYGIQCAEGSHIMFVDSDDYLHPECLKMLVELIETNNAQISCVGQFRIDEDITITDYPKIDFEKVELINGIKALELLCLRKIGTSACGKLYEKRFFEDIKFPYGVLHEDICTIPYILEQAQSVAYANEALYYYVQRKNSIMHKHVTEYNIKSFAGVDNLVGYVDKNHPELHEAAMVRWIIDFFEDIMNRLIYQDDFYAIAKQMRTKYQKNFKEVLGNRYVNRVKKVQAFLILYNLPLFRISMRILGIRGLTHCRSVKQK